MSKKKWYAVRRGRKNGLFEKWYGEGGAWEQVNGFPGAVFKGFEIREEAQRWLEGGRESPGPKSSGDPSKAPPRPGRARERIPAGAIVIYTDGGSLNNPGPGGYGIVELCNGQRREFSGGYRLTTNNRMELTACIEALKRLRCKGPVILHSDSKYVVDGITKGWARRWRARGWMRTATERAKNADLWAQLLDLVERHEVEFRWVKGHAGIPENERCDALVNREQTKLGLPADTVFEKEWAESHSHRRRT
jgi:ribonuclease HI